MSGLSLNDEKVTQIDEKEKSEKHSKFCVSPLIGEVFCSFQKLFLLIFDSFAFLNSFLVFI